MIQHHIKHTGSGRGFYELTDQIEQTVAQSGITTGTCNIFCEHTSASLILCENADPQVLKDLENFMSKIVQDGDPIFKHTAEGNDDMPAHVRSVLTSNSVTIPITEGKLHTGTWQGIYLWEHRTTASRTRKLVVTISGS